MEQAKVAELSGTNVIIEFSGKKVELADSVQRKIDDYWDMLLASGKKNYFRGDVFTVTVVAAKNDVVHVLVEKTDFAHYLYCQNVDAHLDGFGIRIIHPACLVETLDGKTIFGEMAKWTSRGGIFQLCGGGFDGDDLQGNFFDSDHCIKKELLEELEIDLNDARRVRSFEKKYLKEGGPTNKLSLIYELVLAEDSEQFLKKYDNFEKKLRAKKELPEFEKLIVLEKNKKEIKDFFSKNGAKCDEYMEPLFRFRYS
ncbi:MAG: hypothetical protein WCO05_00440 [Candidatus Moraniibacteriota bacterium]